MRNVTLPQRKTALQQFTDKARKLGTGLLFNKILSLLMQSTLKDQERYLLMKVIDWVLYKTDDLVRFLVHKILVVVEDYYAHAEGRAIISNRLFNSMLKTVQNKIPWGNE